MRRTQVLMAVGAALVMLGPTLSAQADDRGSTHGTAAAAATTWTPLTDPDVGEEVPEAYRTSDGVLHVAYLDEGTGTDFDPVIRHVAVSPAGTVLGRHVVLDDFDWVRGDVDIMGTASGGLRITFVGFKNGDPRYHDENLFHLTSDSSGASWTLQPTALLPGWPIVVDTVAGPSGEPVSLQLVDSDEGYASLRMATGAIDPTQPGGSTLTDTLLYDEDAGPGAPNVRAASTCARCCPRSGPR